MQSCSHLGRWSTVSATMMARTCTFPVLQIGLEVEDVDVDGMIEVKAKTVRPAELLQPKCELSWCKQACKATAGQQ